MNKKLFSLLLATLLIMSVMAVPTFAAIDFSQDFTGIDWQGPGWLEISGDEGLEPAVTVTGIAGKEASDVSVKLENNNYYRRTMAISGHVTIEYNALKRQLDGSLCVAPNGTFVNFPSYRYDGKITHDGSDPVYPSNRWHHIAIELNYSNDEVVDPQKGNFNVYIDGVKKYSNIPISSYIAENAQFHWRFVFFDSPSGSAYIDDVKFHDGGYDASKAVSVPSSDVFSVVGTTVPVADMTGTEYITKFTASNGGKVTGVFDETAFELVTDAKVKAGDLLVVESADKTYSYYTLVDGSGIISSGNYTVDETAKTISGVYKKTRISDFKDTIKCMDNSIEKTIKKGADVVLDGFVENGMTLTLGSNVYTINTFADIVNDNFTGKAGIKLTDYDLPSPQAAAAGLTLDYTGFSPNENGPYGEIINDENDGEILKIYNADTTTNTFIGKNILFNNEWVEDNNILELSIKKADINSATYVYFYGLNKNSPDYVRDLDYFLVFSGDGLITFFGETVGSWDVDKWYRCVLASDIPNNKYTLYINGVKVKEYQYADENEKPTNYCRFRIENSRGDNTSITYLDNINMYVTNPVFSDDDIVAEIKSETLGVTTSVNGCTIKIGSDVERVSDLLSKITYKGKELKVFDREGALVSDDAIISTNMFITLSSLDGFSEQKYIILKDEVISEIIFVDDEGLVIKKAKNGNVNARITITNTNKDIPVEGNFIIAVYEGNRLTSVDITPISVSVPVWASYAQVDKEISAVVKDATKENVKAYFWKDIDSLEPIIMPAELPKDDTTEDF